MDESQKFDTCTHRSLNEVTHIIKRCSCRGGNYEMKGFFCNKKQIFDITKQFCESCEEYQSK